MRSLLLKPKEMPQNKISVRFNERSGCTILVVIAIINVLKLDTLIYIRRTLYAEFCTLYISIPGIEWSTLFFKNVRTARVCGKASSSENMKAKQCNWILFSFYDNYHSHSSNFSRGNG